MEQVSTIPSLMTIAMLAIVGICVYTGINYISLLRSLRQQRNAILFGLLCLYAGCYFLLILYGQTSGSRDALIFSSRWADVLTAVMSLLILWFLAEYINWKPAFLLYLISALYIVQAIVGIIKPYGVTWESINDVVPRTTPWGEQISILTGTVGIWAYVCYTAYALLILYGIIAAVKVIRIRNFQRALTLFVPLLFAVAALFNDMLLDHGKTSSIYLNSYVFLAFIVIIGHDLEKRRLRAESNYHTLFDAMDDAITVHDAYSGKMLDANRAAERLFGVDRNNLSKGTLSGELLPQDVVSETTRIARINLRPDLPILTERLFSRATDGKQIWIEMALRCEKIDGQEVLLAVTRNIDNRKKVENELEKTQRLESLGILAGGIAHDFNNLLSGIYGNIQIAQTSSSEHEMRKYLTETVGTLDRARGLTQQLLTFSKGGAPIRKPAEIREFIIQTTHFALSGSNISSDFDLPDDLSSCEYDKNQIAQVIDNIVINAQQAMIDGGKITVSAKNVLIGIDTMLSLTPGRYIAISIRDNGIGISRGIINKIFDPFFTTKEKGCGLGLATSYSIVKRHGGVILVDSEPGQGTCFTIYLPAAAAAVEKTARNTAVPRRMDGKILVMDDELSIRNAVRVMLKIKGFTVITAADGEETVKLFKEHMSSEKPVTAILLDLTIPGKKGGRDTVRELKAINQDVPVFVYSGYAEDPIIANPRKYGFADSITKPFVFEELAAMFHRNMK
jgi:PAS domain S-box-containing protein